MDQHRESQHLNVTHLMTSNRGHVRLAHFRRIFGLILASLFVVLRAPATEPPAIGQTREQLLGDVAPKLAELTDNVLFGDVWARPQLARRDRSLVTVSALVAMNRPDQLRFHLALAQENGVTEEELAEAITHLAFYAGWPGAMSAAGVAKEVFRKELARASST